MALVETSTRDTYDPLYGEDGIQRASDSNNILIVYNLDIEGRANNSTES